MLFIVSLSRISPPIIFFCFAFVFCLEHHVKVVARDATTLGRRRTKTSKTIRKRNKIMQSKEKRFFYYVTNCITASVRLCDVWILNWDFYVFFSREHNLKYFHWPMNKIARLFFFFSAFVSQAMWTRTAFQHSKDAQRYH